MATGISQVLQDAATATGNGTSLRLVGLSTAVFDVAISASATVTFEAAGDSGSYVSLPAENIATGAVATTATASGLYRADVRGISRIRARISTFGSGTITVRVVATDRAGSSVTGGSGVGALTIGKAEDAAHVSGDVGVPALSVRQNTAAALSGSDGDYQPLITDGAGRLHVVLSSIQQFDDVAYTVGGALLLPVGYLADETATDSVDEGDLGVARMTLNRILRVVPSLHDGTTQGADSMRSNVEGTVLASAARTATTNSADFTNINAKGVRLFINVTAVTADPSVVFTLEVKDPISSTYTAILTSAAITGTGHTVLTAYPGATAAANVTVSMPLSRTWRVTATHADSDSITYSVGYSYIN